jgi:ABC transport system ATP-binding/permease protein
MHEGEGKWTEYAGGYSDMVAQRGEGVVLKAVKSAERGKSAAAEPRLAPQPRQKLSFKEKHALETLPTKMIALRAELGALESQLADASLFARNPKAFDRASLRHAAAAAELATAEEQWLDLEILRESLA